MCLCVCACVCVLVCVCVPDVVRLVGRTSFRVLRGAVLVQRSRHYFRYRTSAAYLGLGQIEQRTKVLKTGSYHQCTEKVQLLTVKVHR